MSPNLIHQLLEGKDKDENRTEPIRKRKQMKEKRRENELCKLYLKSLTLRRKRRIEVADVAIRALNFRTREKQTCN